MSSPDPSLCTRFQHSPGLTEHLREVQEQERRQQELRPATSISPGPNIDPIFSGNPYGLAETSRTAEQAKISASRRERELSATKRAAQNRAAQVSDPMHSEGGETRSRTRSLLTDQSQRAFRQRKEGHIQELEQQVNRYKALGEAHKTLQIENHQLREYVSTLQSILIEVGGSVPTPPPGLDIHGGTERDESLQVYPAKKYGPLQGSASPSSQVAPTRSAAAQKTNGGNRRQRQQQQQAAVNSVSVGAPSSEHEAAAQTPIEPRLMNA